MKRSLMGQLPILLLASTIGLGACASTATMSSSTTIAQQASATAISRDEVIAAQNAWGAALVRISTTYDNQGLQAATRMAATVLDSAYGYAWGPVLFKPTLTTAPQTFRTTLDGALAYFVGHSSRYPGDTGFALKHWRDVQIENAAIFIDDDIAISMGNVRFTDRDGNVTVVDKTWGYKRDENGTLRIVLHHSSLPYNPG